MALVLVSLIPALAVFILLVAFHVLSPVSSLVGLVTWAGVTLWLHRRQSSDLAAAQRFARELALDDDVVPPDLRNGLARDLVAGLIAGRRRQRAQGEEMRARVEFHESLFDSLPSPILVLDRQRRVIGENAAARKIFGRQPRDRDLAALIRNPDLLDAVDQVLAGHAGPAVELTMPTPVNTEFRVMMEPLPKAGADGAAVVLSLHDITEMKRVEQMRGDFIANASHELRTPLAAILGFIETLRGPARDDAEAQERFLAIMLEQATRMSRLVADLLNLSRIELHEHSRPEGQADLSAILWRVAAGFELQAGAKRMAIELDLAEPLPMVIGEEEELAQIFQNLIDNALKYGRDGTAVEITGRIADQAPAAMNAAGRPALKVTVRDHGEGIAREHLPRLTERFFRVDTARSRQLGGTGLGLAIVKHVISRHRGVLQIDSELGEGTCFTVYLPTL